MSNQTLFSELEGLWIQAGGSAALAPLMAGIGLNEGAVSDPYGINPDTGGTKSAGIWQINSANWGGLQKYGIIASPNDLTDPLINARAAVFLAGRNGQNIADTWASTYAKGQAAALQYGLTSAPTPNPYPSLIAASPNPDSSGGSGNYIQQIQNWWQYWTGQGGANIDPNTGQPRPGTSGVFTWDPMTQIKTWQWLIVAGGLLIIGLAIIAQNHQEEIINLGKVAGEAAA